MLLRSGVVSAVLLFLAAEGQQDAEAAIVERVSAQQPVQRQPLTSPRYDIATGERRVSTGEDTVQQASALLAVLAGARSFLRSGATTPPPVSPILPDFETFVYHGADVDLHDLTTVSGGGALYDVAIDWGDGSPKDYLRCPYPTATDPPVKWMCHGYKTAGIQNITITATDSLGNTATRTKQVVTTLPSGSAAPIPTGRFFDDGTGALAKDQFPGTDPRNVPYSQPHVYLDTTRPTVLAGDILTAADEAELTAAYNTLATGACTQGRHGKILYTGGDIDAWVVPERPFDANGERYPTYIWIETDATVRPVGYDDSPGAQMVYTIGVQLPAFRATSNANPAIFLGGSTDQRPGCYNIRFTGFGIAINPSVYTFTRTGGGLVTMGDGTWGVIFEQCYSYMPDEVASNKLIGCRRDFFIAGGGHAWLDGWHWGNRDNNTDSQCIWGVSLTGPIKIVNCLLGGAGEPFMTGGAAPRDPKNPELPYRPRDIEVRLCTTWRDQARVPMNIRYYDGSGLLNPGRLFDSGVAVSAWDSATRTLTLATPVTVPDGSFAKPNPGLRTDWVIYVRSGAGAGQGARVSSFTSSTVLKLGAQHADDASAPAYLGITTALDATSVIELRLKILWWSKNNGEFKDCRRAMIHQCVFENGSVGIDSQYYMNNFKTTVNSSSDWYPSVNDINVVDCVYLNTFGGITMSGLPLVGSYGAHGITACRFNVDNVLMLAGDARNISTAGGTWGNNKFKPLNLGVDRVRVRGLTALGFNWGIAGWQEYPGGEVDQNEHNSIRGLIVTAPTTAKANAYWFSQRSHLDDATADIQGNAVIGTSSMPSDPPGGSSGWHCEPSVTRDDVLNNPDKADVWGAADFGVKTSFTAFRANTPDRLDFPRLQANTAGVRPDPTILPYQWD